MRTFLSLTMALLFVLLFAEPIAVQSSESSHQRCDSTIIYNVNDVVVGKTIFAYDQTGNILSETTYRGENITKKVEYTYSGQGYKKITYVRRNRELTRTEESEYNNLGQELVKIEYHLDNYSPEDGENNQIEKVVFTYYADGTISSQTIYDQYGYDDPDSYEVVHYEYNNNGDLILEAFDGPDYDENGNLVYLNRSEFTYDTQGNMLSWYSYCPKCRIVNSLEEWTYDSYGRVSTLLVTAAIAPHSNCHREPWSGPMDDDYYDRYVDKFVYEYDSEDNLVNVTAYTSIDNPIDISQDYYYGWWHNVSLRYEITLDEDEIESEKHEKEYDSRGNIVWKAEYGWHYVLNGEKYMWRGYIHVYDYDDYDHLTGESYYTYNDYENRWEGEYNYEYIYDENGHRLSTIYYKEAYITSRSVSNHQDSNYQWINDTKTDYTYDELGNVIKATSYTWSNNQWNEGYHTIYYYTADNTTIENITSVSVPTSPRKVFKDGKLQIEFNGKCYGMDGIRY